MNEWGFKDLCAYNYAYLSQSVQYSSFTFQVRKTYLPTSTARGETPVLNCEKLFGSLVLVMGLVLKPWGSKHSNVWNVGFWKVCLKGFCHNHIQEESSNSFCSLKCRCFSWNVPKAAVDLQQTYTLRGRSDRPPTESFSIWVFLIWQKLLSEAAHKKSLLFSEDRREMSVGVSGLTVYQGGLSVWLIWPVNVNWLH